MASVMVPVHGKVAVTCITNVTTPAFQSAELGVYVGFGVLSLMKVPLPLVDQ